MHSSGINVNPVDDEAAQCSAYSWLVHAIVAEYLHTPMEREDLLSAGTLGLLKGIRNYEPRKGATLKTYARWRIRGAILDELRRAAGSVRRGVPAKFLSLDHADIEDEYQESPSDAAERSDNRELLAVCLRRLPKQSRTVVTLFYFEGRTQPDIGRRFGVSGSWISQILTAARVAMKKDLSQMTRTPNTKVCE